MDRSIELEVKRSKKRKLVLIITTVIIIFSFLLYLLRGSLATSVKAGNITIGTIDVGPIENTIYASGEILPEFEEVISSPIDASIQKVIIEPGTNVETSQPILLLDKSLAETEYKKQLFQLQEKDNDIQKLKLELGKTFYDIQSSNNIKQLNINNLDASLQDAKRLYKAGGATKEDVAHAELNLKVANLEKKQLENELRNKQQTMQLQIKQSEIAYSIQKNDVQSLARKLELANVIAKRQGVITWVNKNIGAVVKQGEVLAKIADLGSFKISGTISDSYLDRLKIGMPVIMKVNDSSFRGVIAAISPSVQNSMISFTVQLAEKSNKLFRPNMKIDLALVTSVKNNVLRAPNGPAFKGGAIQDIFVVTGLGKAERRTVRTGISNLEFVEVDNSLSKGDKIIISDMGEYKNVKEVTIKN